MSPMITIAAGTVNKCALFKSSIIKAIYVKHLIREKFSLNVNITQYFFIFKWGEGPLLALCVVFGLGYEMWGEDGL
jgi:hypothetical protein